jgi:hypothetical protein
MIIFRILFVFFTIALAMPSTYAQTNDRLTLKLYIEGLYSGQGTLATPLYSSGTSFNSQYADSILVSLAQNSEPFTVIFSTKVLLQSNGIAIVEFPSSFSGQNCYIKVQLRNSIETWSKQPVLLSSNTYWNLSTIAQFAAVATSPLSAISSSTAVSGGTISSDGGSAVTERGVVWNTSPTLR